MNRHLKRRRNFSIIIIIVGLLMVLFKDYIALAFFGTTFMYTFLVFIGGITLFFLGVVSLARLYFHGDI